MCSIGTICIQALIQKQLQGSMHESQQLKRQLERQISEDIEVIEKQRKEYEHSAQTIESKLAETQAHVTELTKTLDVTNAALEERAREVIKLQEANSELLKRIKHSEEKRSSLKLKFKASLKAAVKRQNDEALALLKNQLLKKYEAQLQEALAEQSAGIAQGETKNKQNILISELKAQVDHQDKQKKLLRQKYRDLKNEMQELQVTQNRPSTHEQGKIEGHVILDELKLFVK